ncbi:hypothetical protein H4582DRAFT_106423 [Lactarius indigo]|nr:hypothetical protein H4582DRAFT_106423 [Lactarius indigo]
MEVDNGDRNEFLCRARCQSCSAGRVGTCKGKQQVLGGVGSSRVDLGHSWSGRTVCAVTVLGAYCMRVGIFYTCSLHMNEWGCLHDPFNHLDKHGMIPVKLSWRWIWPFLSPDLRGPPGLLYEQPRFWHLGRTDFGDQKKKKKRDRFWLVPLGSKAPRKV